MPRFLTYEQLVDFFFLHNCQLSISKDEFTPDVTKNKVPYYCPIGHHITNLTKNNFNSRINQGQD